MTTFAYSSGNPANLTSGANASMADIKGPLDDLKTYLNGANLDSTNIATNGVALAQLAAAVQAALVPAGSLLATGAAAAPTGYLLCDGSAVSRSTYADLFTAIGTTYGAGNGSTTFNVPDLRGRVPVGVDGAAGRLTANDALGNSAGEETHALVTGELATHLHAFGASAPVQAPVLATGTWSLTSIKEGGGAGVTVATPSDSSLVNSTGTANNGSGTAHNNMQPYQIVNWIIKT